MKRFSLSPVSAGLALAIMSGPLAIAQQYPNHDDTHGNMHSHSVRLAIPQHNTMQRGAAQPMTTWAA